ncbi:MAG: cation transporter [Bacteroidota bacterium]
MNEFQFKTNINCGNCVRAVQGFLAEVEQLESWEVNTEHPDKILTVKGTALRAETVLEAIEEAGFNATHIS